MKALAVFHQHGCHILDPFLKPGFRHVFVVVETGDYWVLIDSQAGVMTIEMVAPATYDLATFYRAEGFTVVETSQRSQPTRGPFSVANCVGFVKTVLGIRSAAMTPWQLYKYLRKSP